MNERVVCGVDMLIEDVSRYVFGKVFLVIVFGIEV